MADNQLHSIGAGAPVQQQNFPSETTVEKQEGHLGAVSVGTEVPNPAQAHHVSVAGQQTILSSPHPEAPALPEHHSIEHLSPRSPVSSPRTQTVATKTLPKESISTAKSSSHAPTKTIGKMQLYDMVEKGKVEEFKQVFHHLDLAALKADGVDLLKDLIDNIPNKMGDVTLNKLEMLQLVAQKLGANLNDKSITMDGEFFGIDQTLNISYLTFAFLKESNPAVLKVLMEAGADLSQAFVTNDIHVLSSEKGSVLLDVFTSGNPSVAEKNPEMAKNVLFECVFSGLDKGVELLAEKGVKLDSVDKKGNNLLHIACTRNGPNAAAMVKLLISKGVDINVANKAGFQPLALTILSQPDKRGEAAYFKIVSLLVENKATITSSKPETYAVIYLSTLMDYTDPTNESTNFEISDTALKIESQQAVQQNDGLGQVLLKDILSIADQTKRAALSVVYFDLRDELGGKDEILKNLYPEDQQKAFPHAAIPMMLISCLKNNYVSTDLTVTIPPEVFKKYTTQLNQLNTLLKDSLQNLAFKKPFVDLLTRLHTIQNENTIDDVIMAQVNTSILNILCGSADPKTFLSNVQKIQTILDLNLIESFAGVGLKEGEAVKLDSLHAKAMDELRNLFKMNPAQFEEITGVFRDPEQFREPAFLTVWSARLSTIENDGDRERILGHLRSFVATVYKENTVVVTTVDPKTKQTVQKRVIDPTRRREKRYDISNESDPCQNHLRAVFGTRPELFAKWKAGASVDFNAFVEARVSPPIVTADFIKAHIGALPLPALKEFLDPATSKETKEKIKSNLTDQLKIKPKVANASIIGLQSNMIRFLESNPKFDGNPNNIGKMNQILVYLKNEGLTKNSALTKEWGDLMGKLRPNSKYEGWTVVDTDNVQDLLMVGNDVKDSCQEMRREPKYTKCLLGSQLDGKYKLIAVKNKEGVIISRAFARIVLDSNDPKEGKPLLFMEKMYNNPMADSFTKQAVIEMFHARSEDMGIPLGSWNPKEDKENDQTIRAYSLGGPAPEYVDAIQTANDDPDEPEFDHRCNIISRNNP